MTDDKPASQSWEEENPEVAPDAAPVEADPTPEVPEEPVFATAPPAADFVPTENFGEVPTPSGNATAIKFPLLGDDWNFAPPSADTQQYIQEALTLLDLYEGKTNGKFGNLSVNAIQQVVKEVAPKGWTYIPGRPDLDLCIYIQKYSVENGGYSGLSDGSAQLGILNEDAWLSFANALGLKVTT